MNEKRELKNINRTGYVAVDGEINIRIRKATENSKCEDNEILNNRQF